MRVKLLQLYTIQQAQAKDEAQRQDMARKIAAEQQRLAVLLPELGIGGGRDEDKQP